MKRKKQREQWRRNLAAILSMIMVLALAYPGGAAQTEAAAEMMMNRTELNMPLGSYYQLKVQATDASGAPVSDLVWKSENEGVATVEENGTIHPVAAGETRINVSSAASGQEGSCRVKVYDPDNPVLVNLAVGKKITATCTNGGYYPEYVVDGNKGNDSYWDGAYAPASFTIDLGGEYELLKFVAYPYWWTPDSGWDYNFKYTVSTSLDGENFETAASKTDSAFETENGHTHELSQTRKARYVKVEMTEASCSQGEQYKSVLMCEFEVYGYDIPTQPQPQLTLSKKSLLLPAETAQSLKARGTDEWGDPITEGIEWKSSDESIAAVDGNGNVTTRKAGEVEITASHAGYGLSAACQICVIDPQAEEIREILKNVALGKPVSATVAATKEADPTLITDGDRYNYWGLETSPHSFTIDLEEEYEIEKIVAFPWFGDGRAYYYDIAVSADGKSYQKVAEKKDNTPETPEGTAYLLTKPAEARYIRVTMNGGSKGAGIYMNELEVYGKVYAKPVEAKININKASLRMPVGADTVLQAAATDQWGQAAEDVIFKCKDEAIATVGQDGTVHALKTGQTEIAVSSEACEKIVNVAVEVYEPAKEPEEIKIMVNWPPSGSYTTEEQYDLIRDANFNRVMGTFSSDLSNTSTIMKIAKLCAERNMDFIAGEGALGFKTDLSDETVASVMDTYQYVAGIGGFILIDEPGVGTEKNYAKLYKQIKKKWPDCYPHINFLPSAVYGSEESYQAALDGFAKAVGEDLEYLMFDRYPFGPAANSFDSNMFSNLDSVRKVGLENDVKTATFLQAVGFNGMRRPNGREIGYEAAVALAYGYKQLAYFTYFQPEGRTESFTEAIMDAKGNKTDLYEPVKEINRQIRNLSPVLVHLDATEVYHAGSLDGQQAVPKDFFAQIEGNGKAILSHMEKKNSRNDYLMVVNKDFVNPQELTLSFDSDIIGLKEISKEDGKAIEIAMEGSQSSLRFEAGEGKLFALIRESNIVEGVVEAALEELMELLPNAKEGTRILIQAKSEDCLPAEVQEAIAGKEITLEITLENGVVWVINGKDLSPGGREDLWLKVVYGGKEIGTVPASVIDSVKGAVSYKVAKLEHSGDFRGKVYLSFPSGKENTGKYGNLFYYNEEKGKLEYVSSVLINDEGAAKFELLHASQYVVYISEKRMSQDSIVTDSAAQDPESPGNSGTGQDPEKPGDSGTGQDPEKPGDSGTGQDPESPGNSGTDRNPGQSGQSPRPGTSNGTGGVQRPKTVATGDDSPLAAIMLLACLSGTFAAAFQYKKRRYC